MRKKNNFLKQEYFWDVVGIGASTMDHFVKVKAFPKGRQVEEALVTAHDGGGPVSTALCTASRLGARVAMIDVIGDDATGTEILRDFAKYSVDTSAVAVIDGAQSGAAYILVEQQHGNRAVFFERSTAPELKHLSQAHKELIAQARILHINGRHKDVLLEAIAYAHSVGTLVSLDGGADRYSPFMDQVAVKSDICILARDFAQKYTNTDDLAQACRRIKAKGALIAGVTAGASGSYLIDRHGEEYFISPYPVDTVVDNTGCGDSYHGAFLYAVCRGYDIQEAGHIASLVGSINTQTLGGRCGLPDLAQVLGRLDKQ